MSRQLIPLELSPYPPGTRALGYLGRDCRSRSKAPGPGPAAWTEVLALSWLWPKDGEGDLVAEGLLARVVGTSKEVRFLDPRLLAPKRLR